MKDNNNNCMEKILNNEGKRQALSSALKGEGHGCRAYVTLARRKPGERSDKTKGKGRDDER